MEENLEKLRRFCVYQDRCHQEVRTKLLSLKVYGDELEEIMSELISENFLNEERFARSYCRGKYKIKKWGRNKIRQELKKRRISEYCIKKGMTEIEEDIYLENLNHLIEKKSREYRGKPNIKDKLGKFLITKGYESYMVWDRLKHLSI